MIRILIVDDEPAILNSYRRLLGPRCAICAVSSVAAAVFALENQDFDVILADNVLPGESGLSLLDWARTRYPTALRVLCSGGTPFDLGEQLAAGVVQIWLPKPTPAADLWAVIDEAERRSRR